MGTLFILLYIYGSELWEPYLYYYSELWQPYLYYYIYELWQPYLYYYIYMVNYGNLIYTTIYIW